MVKEASHRAKIFVLTVIAYVVCWYPTFLLIVIDRHFAVSPKVCCSTQQFHIVFHFLSILLVIAEMSTLVSPLYRAVLYRFLVWAYILSGVNNAYNC
jgi:hypothetical protein